jgi:hypothetical protein
MGLSTELTVALTAAAAAIVSAIIAIWGQVRMARMQVQVDRERASEQRAAEAAKILARFRDPLLRAAYDLQSRLYNIVEQDLVGVYVSHGTAAERDYVFDNTRFLISQYLGWVEIIRREIQFLDLGDLDRTRRLAELQHTIAHLWLSDGYGREFRIFAGEQRALGERMTRETSRGLECLGYAGFLDEMKSFGLPCLEKLHDDLAGFGQPGRPGQPRLVVLQNALIDLIDYLDPECVRFPKQRRTRISA